MHKVLKITVIVYRELRSDDLGQKDRWQMSSEKITLNACSKY